MPMSKLMIMAMMHDGAGAGDIARAGADAGAGAGGGLGGGPRGGAMAAATMTTVVTTNDYDDDDVNGRNTHAAHDGDAC
jgi:hypothetical protein